MTSIGGPYCHVGSCHCTNGYWQCCYILSGFRAEELKHHNAHIVQCYCPWHYCACKICCLCGELCWSDRTYNGQNSAWKFKNDLLPWKLSLSLHMWKPDHIYVYHWWCKYAFLYVSASRLLDFVTSLWYSFDYFKEFERSRAFLYLNEVKGRFQATYGSRAETAIAYSMNNDFSMTMAHEMVSFVYISFSCLCVLFCFIYII